MRTKARAARLIAVLGLPRLPELPLRDPATHAAYEDFTRTHIDPPGSSELLQPPQPTTTYLRWLAVHRPVLFHGSQRRNLTQLRPDRESTDRTEFGNQRAVFASDDPVWAMWFALLRRGPGFRSTRNGVWSIRGNREHRAYFFSVDSDQPDHELLTDGWLYVLPQQGFTAHPPLARLLQPGEWVNPQPVEPLARLAVTPADFPFADRIVRHHADDSMLNTLLRARTAHRGR